MTTSSTFQTFKNYFEPVFITKDYTIVKCFDETGTLIKADVHIQPTKKPSTSQAQSYNSKAIDNVIVLFFPSVSRQHFRLQLPKTNEFLENLIMEKISLQSSSRFEVFRFRRYNIMGPESLHNQIPLFTGSTLKNFLKQKRNNQIIDKEIGESNAEWLWDSFKQAGYITGFGEEHCLLEKSVRKFWNLRESIPNLDYQFLDLFCEQPSLVNPFLSGSVWKHGLSCFGQHAIHNLTFQFLYKVSQEPYPFFVSTSFMEGAEFTHLRLKTMDQDLLSFLKYVEEKLPSTAVFLLSDQGQYLTSYYNQSKNGKLEHKQPFLYMMLPSPFLKQYPAYRYNLRFNQYKLINALDIYSTLKTFTNSPSSFKQLSLFDPMPKKRTCQEIQIDSEWCLCEDHTYLIILLLLLLPFPVLVVIWWCWIWKFHFFLGRYFLLFFPCQKKRKPHIVSTMKI